MWNKSHPSDKEDSEKMFVYAIFWIVLESSLGSFSANFELIGFWSINLRGENPCFGSIDRNLHIRRQMRFHAHPRLLNIYQTNTTNKKPIDYQHPPYRRSLAYLPPKH